MKSFLNWLEDTAPAAPAAPAASSATISTSTSGSPGSTTTDGIAQYLEPVGIVRRRFASRTTKKHKRHERHKS